MNYKRLAISIFLPQFAGILGSFFTMSAIPNWYTALQKASFGPPNWLFGPVWIFLYFLMGISVYLVWQRIDKNNNVKQPLTLFWVHLFFNAIWSIIFFGLKNPGLALMNIITIWFFIIFLIFNFWKINKLSSYLLIPYLLWVSFASILNFYIWQLN